VSNLIVDHFPTNAKMGQPWFIASVDIIKGLIDRDIHVVQGDQARGNELVVKDEDVDEAIIENSHCIDAEERDGVEDLEGHGVEVFEEANVLRCV
nr:hypothetical protein [Tanacetum cinerariifolium]GEZ55555.1 hypothetical protein [Tanacetum cinerariifolium]